MIQSNSFQPLQKDYFLPFVILVKLCIMLCIPSMIRSTDNCRSVCRRVRNVHQVDFDRKAQWISFEAFSIYGVTFVNKIFCNFYESGSSSGFDFYKKLEIAQFFAFLLRREPQLLLLADAIQTLYYFWLNCDVIKMFHRLCN